MPILLDPANVLLLRRDLAEGDPEYRQLIPYVVFKSAGLLFCYRRAADAGETRLSWRQSIGVGGHIEESDIPESWGWDAYQAAMRREVAEEVDVRASHSERIVGMIREDSSSVGKVHIGVLHLWELQLPLVTPRGHELAEAAFRPWPEIKAARDGFERWSQIAMRMLGSQMETTT